MLSATSGLGPQDGTTQSVHNSQHPSTASSVAATAAEDDVIDRGDLTDTSEAIAGSPDYYAASIRAYAQRSQERYLICGLNFRQLAQYLNQSGQYASIQPFSCVISTQLYQDKDKQFKIYNDVTGPQDFLANDPLLERNSAKLLFLRGYPSAEWLRTLGWQFRIDGEYFRRHLDFLASKKYFDLPALPSSTRNILQLRVTTICTRQSALTLQEVHQSRIEELDIVRTHQQQLGNTVGESIVRRYSVLDETFFTIEQNISCYVARKGAGWAVIVWLDTGRALTQGSWAPWVGPPISSSSLSNACLPTIQHHPKASLLLGIEDPQPGADILNTSTLPASNELQQSAGLLPSQYGRFLDADVMRLDVMYALTDVFRFVSSSESQFINLMQSQVSDALRSAKTQEELSLATLQYCDALLGDHIMHITETIHFIKSRGDPKWPRARATDDRHWCIATEARNSLLEDFELLLERAKMLAKTCTNGAGLIVNDASLQESRRALVQAEKVERLTLLAFFFVPLAFVCSFFGMNFVQFGQGSVNIEVFFVVSVPVLILSAVLCFWDRLSWQGLWMAIAALGERLLS